ncbi:hypothetical protein BGZ80_010546 [Entomortierella chlamydospora]|uniref:AAA+ ATPase domain-containing protein n=1 Tax=Entomortierella chlamydospora TaxID=101097 RepID=A0A9P6MVQ2_9FUNG|nr:hypothetical protein BGZ80_010546 [Entomortierella chlamydospora]
MLSLIRTATKAPPFNRTHTSFTARKAQCIHATNLVQQPRLIGIPLRNTQPKRTLHHSPGSYFSKHSAAAAEAPSGADPSPPPQSSGETTPPSGDPSPNSPDKNNKSASSSIDAPSSSSSRQTASSAKRKLKTPRLGKATVKAIIISNPATEVYVPVIPESFLATRYHPASTNHYDISKIPYHIHESILNELLNTIASCLLSPHAPQTHIQRMPARHNNLIISSPSEGSSKMLETLTMAAAKKIGADVITVDMQDLMELTPDIFNSKGIGNSWPVDHLSRGFNPFVAAPIPLEFMEEIEDDDDDDDDDTDESNILSKVRRNLQEATGSPTTPPKEMLEKFWTALMLAEPAPSSTSRPRPRDKSLPKIVYLKDIADIILTPFGSMLLPSLTSAVLTLRRAGHNIMVVAGHSPSLLKAEGPPDEDQEATEPSKGGDGTTSVDAESTKDVPLVTILQKLLTPTGEGHHQGALRFGHISLSSLTFDSFPGPTHSFHHISIPPFLPPAAIPSGSAEPPDHTLQLRYALENMELLKRDKASKVKEVNCRNLHAVLLFRGGTLPESESASDFFGTLRGVDSEVWGFGKVFRIISNAIGSLHLSEIEKKEAVSANAVLSQNHIRSALEAYTENTILRKQISSNLNSSGKKEQEKPLIRPEDCSFYERRLLGSIVDPNKIKTTFKNTIIPPETIHTLQTMITLPLVRPQLFSHGLLQNEFLSGLLLFGPPGTGKTLLAKAVAKESGARMLEIKASDIFDMYVGEGEKNVSAVFSLARKLSPCVIFLDEVDSIFRARGSGGGGPGSGGNSSHREILNQFMVEWDGLRSSGQNQGIVVMGSTNRPFELDDAVLRRLPRRILVDLPSEQAREQILNVYLGSEQLEDVDIKDLAKKTKFFSGSDLKNLCVSAALASVREEVENEVRSLQHTDDNVQPADGSLKEKDTKVLDLSPLLDEYKKKALTSVATKGSSPVTDVESTPPSRVIRKRHIEKALSQITPSCSENMDSLTELRKWDGLYGDGGKGRRKAVKGIGFEVAPSSPTDADTAKI